MFGKPLVIIESPFAGDVDNNVKYAQACMLDSLKRGEAPYASHLLYTQCLNDLEPKERKLGIEAGLAWGAAADMVVVYVDKGISDGMAKAIEHHKRFRKKIEYRKIYA